MIWLQCVKAIGISRCSGRQDDTRIDCLCADHGAQHDAIVKGS